jgi:4a-hydroxytetrahydrobiopterin dehydratase
MVSRTLLDDAAVADALSTLNPGWTGDTSALRRSMEFATFQVAVEFVNRIAPRAEELDHHPDLALRWRWVDVVLSTHSAGGVTELDVALARSVDEVAATLPMAGSSVDGGTV